MQCLSAMLHPPSGTSCQAHSTKLKTAAEFFLLLSPHPPSPPPLPHYPLPAPLPLLPIPSYPSHPPLHLLCQALQACGYLHGVRLLYEWTLMLTVVSNRCCVSELYSCVLQVLLTHRNELRVCVVAVSVSNYLPSSSLVPLSLPYIMETFCKYPFRCRLLQVGRSKWVCVCACVCVCVCTACVPKSVCVFE